jgi:Ca-activated chloride channel homolog
MACPRWSRRLGVLAALLGIAPGLDAAEKSDPQPSGFQMSVGVTLNTVTVAVLDGKNRYRTDLAREDFELLVDGKPWKIEDFNRTDDEPLDLAVLLDVSGSMRFDAKIERARWVIKEVVGRLRPDEQAALMIFADGRIETAVPYTNDRPKLYTTLDGIQAYGKTALSDALGEAATLVQEHESLSPALVLITDGFENASKTKMSDTLSLLRWRGVPVYPLAVVAEHVAEEARHPDQGSDFEMLRNIAAETGGRPFVVTASESMASAVSGIFQDLRSRYRLGYYAPDTKGNRIISVNVLHKDFKVRYRRGYKS